MATRVFADEELERLRGFPEIGREELFRFFTLTPADVAFVDPGRGLGPANRLGLAVALCAVPWLGFAPDKVSAAPASRGGRLAQQLKVDAEDIRSCGKRSQTRTKHPCLAAQHLGRRPPGAMELKELEEFLLARVMEHDSPTLLFRLACEYPISARVIQPSPDTLVRRVAHAREQVQRETYDLLARSSPMSGAWRWMRSWSPMPRSGCHGLRWLSTGPVDPSASAVKAEVTKLGLLRGLGADRFDGSGRPLLAHPTNLASTAATDCPDPAARWPPSTTTKSVTRWKHCGAPRRSTFETPPRRRGQVADLVPPTGLGGTRSPRVSRRIHPAGLRHPVRSRTAIDRLIARRDIHLRETTLWQMLYETCASADELLQINIEGLNQPGRCTPVKSKGAKPRTRRRGGTRLGESGVCLLELIAKSRRRKSENLRRYLKPVTQAMRQLTSFLDSDGDRRPLTSPLTGVIFVVFARIPPEPLLDRPGRSASRRYTRRSSPVHRI